MPFTGMQCRGSLVHFTAAFCRGSFYSQKWLELAGGLCFLDNACDFVVCIGGRAVPCLGCSVSSVAGVSNFFASYGGNLKGLA